MCAGYIYDSGRYKNQLVVVSLMDVPSVTVTEFISFLLVTLACVRAYANARGIDRSFVLEQSGIPFFLLSLLNKALIVGRPIFS